MKRTCTGCGTTARTEKQVRKLFYVNWHREGVTRFRAKCKECSKAAASEWRTKNPEKWKPIHQRAQQKRTRAKRKEEG